MSGKHFCLRGCASGQTGQTRRPTKALGNRTQNFVDVIEPLNGPVYPSVGRKVVLCFVRNVMGFVQNINTVLWLWQHGSATQGQIR